MKWVKVGGDNRTHSIGPLAGGGTGSFSETVSSVAPALASAVVPSAGTSATLTFTVPAQPLLPASGITGLTLKINGAGATVTSARTSNTVITLTLVSPATIFSTDTVTLDYAPGNITDSVPTSLATFSGTSVTNNSTQSSAFSIKSLSFGGTNQFASRADANAQDVGSAGTWSLWVKGAGVGNYGGLVTKSDPVSGPGWAIGDSGDSANKVYMQILDPTNQKRYNTSTAVLDGAWHHVVFTFASSTLKVYIDRVLDTPIKTVDDAVSAIAGTGTGLRMGSQVSNGTPGTYFTGKINNFSLWSIALNQTEINALATGGKPNDLSAHSQYANCVSWYKSGDGDTIGANGIIDTKSALHLSPTNMVSGDIVTDAP